MPDINLQRRLVPQLAQGRSWQVLVWQHEPAREGQLSGFRYGPVDEQDVELLAPYGEQHNVHRENEYRLFVMWSPKVLEIGEQKVATRIEPDVPRPFSANLYS